MRTAAATPRYASAQWARAFDQIDLDPGEYRGTRMLDLARQSLERISSEFARAIVSAILEAF